MPIVYRLESEDGEGIYQMNRDAEFEDVISPFMMASLRHPRPNKDAGLAGFWSRTWATSHWYFGFSSKAQMKRWFNSKKARKVFAEKGVQCNLYEVSKDDFRRGVAQAIFVKHRAKLVKTLDPSEWV